MLIEDIRWEVALAALRSGIILSPATTMSTEKDIQYRCIRSKARLFVGDATSVAKFLAVQQNCPSVRTVIQVGDDAQTPAISLYPSLEKIAANANFRSTKRHWSRPAVVFFTSGTSGPPKMVRHNQISYPLGEISK